MDSLDRKTIARFFGMKNSRGKRDLVVRGVSLALTEVRWTATVINPVTARLINFHRSFGVASWKPVPQLVIDDRMYDGLLLYC